MPSPLKSPVATILAKNSIIGWLSLNVISAGMLLRGNHAGKECCGPAAAGAGCNWTANVRTNPIARAAAVLLVNLFRDGTRGVLIILSCSSSLLRVAQ